MPREVVYSLFDDVIAWRRRRKPLKPEDRGEADVARLVGAEEASVPAPETAE